MKYQRMPIETESPEEMGYNTIRYNLAESSVRDRILGELDIDLRNVVLAYGEHRGIVALRQCIAAESPDLTADDVLVTTGAAMALFVIATSLLSTNDHIVVIRPNYATNIETPRAIGCQMSIIDLRFEDGFDLEVERIKQAIQPNTKIISLTNPHNPTGKVFPESTIQAIIALAEERGCVVVLDETYRDLNFQTPLRPYAALYSPKVISVCSLSKAFGVPGIRIGWLVCRDKTLMHTLLAAKEQMILGNAVLDEEIALHLLRQKTSFLAPIHEHIRHNFQLFKQWMASQPFLQWVEPQAGVVCFPRLKEMYTSFDFAPFQKALYHDYHTVVGYGHWFERPERYFRLGFGYPSSEDLVAGLDCLQKALSQSVAK